MKKPKFILKEDWYLETDILGIKSKRLILEKDMSSIQTQMVTMR